MKEELKYNSINRLIDDIEYEYRKDMELIDVVKEGLITILLKIAEINKNKKGE